jgi:hypothetical protein
MRKIVALFVGATVLACAGSAVAGPGATDTNGDFVDVSVDISPPVSSTAKVPHGVAITFSTFSGNRINANAEVSSTSIVERLNQNFGINSRFFPSCAINTKGLSTCSKASQIGTGTAEAAVLSKTGGAPTYIPATVKVYDGKPLQTKDPTQIFIASLAGKPTAELDFRITHTAGGVNYTEIHFPGAPSSPFFLSKLSFTQPDRTVTRKIKGKKVKIHLVTAPRTCHRAWTFSETLTFASRPPLTATDSQPCLKG